MTTQTAATITQDVAENALIISGILKHHRARQLNANDPKHITALVDYLNLISRVDAADETDARRALEAIKTTTAAELRAIAGR